MEITFQFLNNSKKVSKTHLSFPPTHPSCNMFFIVGKDSGSRDRSTASGSDKKTIMDGKGVEEEVMGRHSIKSQRDGSVNYFQPDDLEISPRTT
ncbi:hypothetical protein CDAR_368201 [Caerostris darwini]|uniref:Ycf15 n=1 Tax=Caerostris darwini TaxID=1538125 RepID=A0AAV4WGM3_9ARAC|nr:hypothetical protein CDAR_368201 [Caerostris darwini]